MNGNTGYSYSADASVASHSPIEMAINDLASNLDSLHDSLRGLETRFGSVLLPEAPTAEGKAGPSAVPTESQVLYCINQLKQRVIDANSRIGSMLNRAQV